MKNIWQIDLKILKQNPKTRKVPKGLKGFFVKLIEWIKSVFERFSNSETSFK